MAKTAGKPMRPIADRVQGIDATVEDLKIRATGRDLELELGVGLLPTPKLTRTINGASSLELEFEDPKRRLLRHLLVSQKWDVEVDGLHFRYPGGLSKSGDTLTLTFEDRWVALLREKQGPKHVTRGTGPHQMTRAEFIKMLVEEAAPGLDFYCPQLHVKQPIKSKSQGKKAKEEAKANRGKGLGATKGLTVKGHRADAEQQGIVDRALRVAEADKAPTEVEIALVAALIDEAECRNPSGGDSSSVGCLQLLDTWGTVQQRLDVERSVSMFLNSGFTGRGGAIKVFEDNPGFSPAEIATAVQGNAAGASVYKRYVAEAREWVEAFAGGSGSITVDEFFTFAVGKEEDYWTAIKRLAKDVNWRAFIVANRFFYMPEPELLAGMVRLAIDDDTPGVENIDFEYDHNDPVTEVTVEAFVAQWKPPPGSVTTLADYGPASIGFPDAPVKADKKGQKAGVSSNRNAVTREGAARLILSSIEVPLSDDPAQRKATINLHRPTPPLPEPAAKTNTISGVSSTAIGNKTVERMLAAAERVAAKEKSYVWGGGHASFQADGYDCSGAVSFELNVGGFLDTPLDTQGLASWGEAGAGEFITVYVKTTGSAEEEHTAIEIAGIVFESGGGGENTNPNGGFGKVDSSQVKDFLKQFDTKRHPHGF